MRWFYFIFSFLCNVFGRCIWPWKKLDHWKLEHCWLKMEEFTWKLQTPIRFKLYVDLCWHKWNDTFIADTNEFIHSNHLIAIIQHSALTVGINHLFSFYSYFDFISISEHSAFFHLKGIKQCVFECALIWKFLYWTDWLWILSIKTSFHVFNANMNMKTEIITAQQSVASAFYTYCSVRMSTNKSELSRNQTNLNYPIEMKTYEHLIIETNGCYE